MKKALICPNEPAYLGWRVAQVEPADQTFPVADPLFWADCADDVVADQFYYDPETQTILPVPQPEQPVATGTQTL